MMNICISIVSHCQTDLVNQLLEDLAKVIKEPATVVIVHNLSEPAIISVKNDYLEIKTIINAKPQGFAKNHNQILLNTDADYVCVINPDIRLTTNPLPALIKILDDPKIGVAAPLILNSVGQIEDSARKFPSLGRLFKRVICRKRHSDYLIQNKPISPEWVAGMFMLFRREVFQQMHGFDERYYLYCEDVDICYRLLETGYQVVLDPSVTAIHNAQRTSHRKLQYLIWHIKSLLRFLFFK